MFRNVYFWFLLGLFTCLGGMHLKKTGWQPVRSVIGDSTDEDIAIARKAAEQIALWLPVDGGRPKVAIARVRGDRDGLLTEFLEARVRQRNVRFISSPWYIDACYALGVLAEPDSDDPIRLFCNAKHAELVLDVDVTQWEFLPDARFSATATLVNPESRLVMFERRIETALADNVTARKPFNPGDQEQRSLVNAKYIPLVAETEETKERFSDVLNTQFCNRYLIWCVGMLIVPLLLKNSVVSLFARRSVSSFVPLVLLFVSTVLPGAWWLWAGSLAYPEGTWFFCASMGVAFIHYGREFEVAVFREKSA